MARRYRRWSHAKIRSVAEEAVRGRKLKMLALELDVSLGNLSMMIKKVTGRTLSEHRAAAGLNRHGRPLKEVKENG